MSQNSNVAGGLCAINNLFNPSPAFLLSLLHHHIHPVNLKIIELLINYNNKLLIYQIFPPPPPHPPHQPYKHNIIELLNYYSYIVSLIYQIHIHPIHLPQPAGARLPHKPETILFCAL